MDNLSNAYIFTDSDNSIQDLNAAENHFKTTSQKTITWMHFHKSPSGIIDTVYFKYNDNFTDQEAEALVNYYFYQIMKNWVPEEILNAGELPVAVREGSEQNGSRLGPCTTLSWQWGKNCLLPEVENWFPGLAFQGGMGVGILDGLLGTIQVLYEAWKGTGNVVVQFHEGLLDYAMELQDYVRKNRSFWKYLKKVWDDTLEKAEEALTTIVEIWEEAKTFVTDAIKHYKPIVKSLLDGIDTWLEGAIDGEAGPGYDVGILAFDVILTAVTGGTGSGSKFLPRAIKWLKDLKGQAKNMISGLLDEASSKINKVDGLAKKIYKCKILGKGCFVAGTPVWMAANNPFKTPAVAYAMAVMPLVAPIQDIKPDDLVVSYHHSDRYLTASNDEGIYVPGWQSYDYLNITPETWQIGTFEIIQADGEKVEVEANRPKTWYHENKVKTIGDKAWFYMLEIGINGEATLLSVRPTVINTTNFALNQSGHVERPVITTFKRYAPVVYDYHFSDGAVIGATPEHPFFSMDRKAYIAVGELQLGEQVMTAGERVVKFIAGKLRDKGEPVYNFEVWREHNYFVSGKDGGEWLLVHNNYGIIQSLIDGIHNATKAFHKPYKCEQYSKALRTYLKNNGINIKTKRWQLTKNGRDESFVIGFDMPDGTSINIATNGFHEFTIINDKIFDNNIFDGMPIEEFMNRIVIPPGYGIREIDIFN